MNYLTPEKSYFIAELKELYESKKVMQYYKRTDSIYYLRTNDSVSIEDVYKYPSFVQFTRFFNTMTIVDKAYNNLMTIEGGLTERHDALIEDLNTIYGVNKSNIDISGNDLKDLCLKHDDYLVENTTWYPDYAKNKLNDEIINYFLSDPYQINDLERYKSYALEEYAHLVSVFLTNSINSYRKIRKFLAEERDIKQDSLYNASGYEKYAGLYSMGEDTVEVVIEDNKLIWIYKPSDDAIVEEKVELYPILDYCFIANGGFNYFLFNKEKGEYDFLYSHLGAHYRFSKVK